MKFISSYTFVHTALAVLLLSSLMSITSIAQAATTIIYSAPGDGNIHSLPYPGSWNAQRTNTSVSQLNYTAPTMIASSEAFYSAGGYLSIKRSYLTFNTTALPDNAFITSATMNVYPKTILDDFDDAYGYINVYQGNHASTTAIVAEDFDTCGNTLTNPTQGASHLDISSLSTTGYESFSLNNNGKSWISTIDFTKLCVREGHDAEDVETVNNTSTWLGSFVEMWSADETGTSKDPYLSINYSQPPLPSESLYTEGSIAPANVTDATPEFSAVFIAPDASDLATHYQVQVSASSTSWDSVLWDSGKTSMATTSTNSRIGDVTYGGSSFDLDGTTYYWRIKLWNSEDLEGHWSGIHYFTMD